MEQAKTKQGRAEKRKKDFADVAYFLHACLFCFSEV